MEYKETLVQQPSTEQLAQEKFSSDVEKYLKFQETYLFFQNEQNNIALMNLFIATGFKEELLVNLSYLRGLEGKEELTTGEIEKLNGIAALGGQEYFEALLRTDAITLAELINLVAIHEQRNYFSMSKELTDKVKGIIASLDSQVFLRYETAINLENVDKIAVFGGRYQTQKERSRYGLEFYKKRKGTEPSTIYFLTGYRTIYSEELVELDIISQNDFDEILKKSITERNPIGLRMDKLIDFISRHQEYKEKFNIERLEAVLNEIRLVSQDFNQICPEQNASAEKMEDILLQNLTFLSLVEERDLFLLAAREIDPNLTKRLQIVYSNGMSGANVLNVDQKPRANTEDTLKTFFDILSREKIDFGNILFVSNGPFVLQQYATTLKVQNQYCGKTQKEPAKVFGENANFGGSGNIAATHFGFLPIIFKKLKNYDFSQYFNKSSVECLKERDLRVAYNYGREKFYSSQERSIFHC